jgi:hypothetical protein
LFKGTLFADRWFEGRWFEAVMACPMADISGEPARYAWIGRPPAESEEKET